MSFATLLFTRTLALLFAALGLWLLLDPRAIEGFYEIGLNDAMAVSEIRAVFGGLMLGVGALTLWLDLARNRSEDATDCLLIVFGALLLARIVGLYIEGIPSGAVRNEAIFELVSFVILATMRFAATRR